MRTAFNIFVLLTLTFTAPARAADSAGDAFFESKIRPVLVEHCYSCHSEEKKIKGGLAVDHREALRRGGDSGVAIVPGEPDKSPLITAVRYKNRDLQMPPKGPLTDAQIRDLETWVRMGAPDPRDAKPAVASAKQGIGIEEGRKFWSFVPLANPKPPTVQKSGAVKSPVDAFIFAELEKAGLQPAPAADKRTLLRRATFDLIGLPPTPAEIDAFLADTSPEAFDKVIDRLLASPHYGERWGRHWLDVARYADSNGMDENVAYGHAWRYRDYVVKAFNSDKPYDQFLIEQIAGDLLPTHDQTSREESVTATGFLALGARVLAEPDVRKLEMDIIDEQLDTIGKAFMGMTIGCSRCHDHKFDPFPTADYYALAAIFRGTRSLSEEKMGAVKFWYERSLATPEQVEAKKQHEAKVKAEKAKLTKLVADARAKLKKDLQSRAADYLAAAAELPENVDYAKVQALAKQRDLRPRYLLTCRQYLSRNREHPVFEQWRKAAAAGQAKEVGDYYGKLFKDVAAALKEAKAKDPKATKPADIMLAAAYAALNDVAGFLAIPDKEADAFDEQTLAEITTLRKAVTTLEAATPELPAVMGVGDGAVVKSLPIHIRGAYLTLGSEVERGFPQVMRTGASQPIFSNKQSGRLELARWMASSEHPLTARVMANRIWRWHFGRGIVGTVDNFGLLGDRPTHPELLDWLARRFIEEGWSIKAMHRLLMKSSVYQMASRHPSTGAASPAVDPTSIDPENKLLWRANVRRLEAEELHDAMLSVSGALDTEIGGKTIPLRNREYVFHHTSQDATRYEATRRALYIPIIRNHLYDVLEQFDYPDPTMPTGSRNATVVAPQALIMMNAPVVNESARRLAARLDKQGSTDEARIQSVYLQLYGRPVTEAETKRAVAFVQDQPDRNEAWTRLCHALLAANEFAYLR